MGRKSRNSYTAVTALIAVIALLAGFVLGRVSVGLTAQETVITEIAEVTQEETVSEAEQETLSAEDETALSEEENAGAGEDSGTEESSETEEDSGTTEETAGEDTSEDGGGDSDLVDAADAEYEYSTDETQIVTHDAVTSVSDEISVVDVSTIENVTLYEAVLPDGVASTLYGKTGTAEFQVVIFGDSQFGNFTGTDGMAYKLSQKLHANVYNLAMGGKTASVDPEEEGNVDINTWEETCGVSMVKAVCGLADGNIVFDGWDYQKNVFNSCDFSKTDLFIIEFGVNDYLAEREMANENNLHNYYTLFGALDTMITDLRTYFPDAQILVCTPTYAQFWESGTGAFLGDAYTVSNFYGTLWDYSETVSHVDYDHTNTTIVDEYDFADIDIYSAPDDLLDGIHLTESGRDKYVSLLSRIALRTMGYDIGEGVDPDTVDWLSQTPSTE